VVDWRRFHPDAFILPMIYTSPDDRVPEGATTTLEVNLPFYHPKTVEIPLAVLGADYVPFEVRLEPLAREFGRVVFTPKWPSSISEADRLAETDEYVLPRSSVDAPCGAIFLVGDRGEVIGYRLVALGSHAITEPLPYGSYRAKFVSTVGWCELPPAGEDGIPFTVGAGSTTVDIDLTGFGGIILSVRDPYGLGQSSAVLRLLPDPPPSRYYYPFPVHHSYFSGFVRFDTREPVTLFPMSSGPYHGHLTAKGIQDGILWEEDIGEISFTVRSGTIDPIEVEWTPR